MSFKDYSATPSANTTIGDDTFIGPNMPRDNVRPALQQIAADGKMLADQVLPAGQRAGKFLTWDANGQAIAAPLTVTAPAGASVSSRIVLAAIVSPVDGQSAILTEAGREGTFVFVSGDQSAMVAADPGQGVWVAPTAAATGASGAWRRAEWDSSLPVLSTWFGGGISGVLAAIDAPLSLVTEVRVPNGVYNVASQILLPSGKIVRGVGDGTIFNVTGFHVLFEFAGVTSTGVRLSDFKVTSDNLTASGEFQGGLIYCSDRPVSDVVIERLTFDAPNHGADAIFFNAKVGAPVSDVRVRDCRFVANGRMNVEFINHDSPDPSLMTGVEITGNTFEVCGAIAVRIQCSLSGAMTAPLVARNTFVGRGSLAEPYAARGIGLEVVAGVIGLRVSENSWSGIYQRTFQNTTNSTNALMSAATLSGNTSIAAGGFYFAAAADVSVTSNAFRVSTDQVLTVVGASRRFLISACQFLTSHTTAIFFDGGGSGSRVTGSIIALTGADSGSNNAVILSGADSTAIAVTNNTIARPGALGSAILEVNGAAGNTLTGNTVTP